MTNKNPDLGTHAKVGIKLFVVTYDWASNYFLGFAIDSRIEVSAITFFIL
jgi:hypothetical protein